MLNMVKQAGPLFGDYAPSRLGASAATATTSSSGSIGLTRCIWKPLASDVIRSCERAYAVSAAAGMLRIGSSIRRSARISCRPSIPGMPMSATMHVGQSARRIASSASGAESRSYDRRAGTFQNRPQQVQRVEFVVDRQHADAVQARNVLELRAPAIGLRLLARGRLAAPPRARSSAAASRVNVAPWPAPLAGRRHRAAVQLGQLLRDREPEAEAAMLARERRVGLPEPLEDERQELRRDAAPVSLTVISTCEFDARETQLHPAAARRELDRVRQQVPDDLLQPIRIAGHRRA